MIQSRERVNSEGCDLSINQPKITNKAHCITSRYDSGITTRKSEGTGVLVSRKAQKIEKKIDVANTLLARDYKGFGNQSMNGVIERNGENNK